MSQDTSKMGLGDPWTPVQCAGGVDIAPHASKALPGPQIKPFQIWVFGHGRQPAVSVWMPGEIAIDIAITLAKLGISAEVRCHG